MNLIEERIFLILKLMIIDVPTFQYEFQNWTSENQQCWKFIQQKKIEINVP